MKIPISYLPMYNFKIFLLKFIFIPHKIDSILKRNQNAPNNAQTINSTEDKYYGMIKAFLDLQEQNKKMQLSNKETEKSINNYIKQRDLMQAESNKSLLAKNKLESLCRELQKHNKLIKEENLQRISKEEEKRKEITLKFQVRKKVFKV
jgi:hypothetical protein